MKTKRSQFGSSFGFLMAAVGSAVGLGNIWGFPYKMGANGGFAFLLVYLLLAVFVGFIVMLGELTLGRKTGRGAIGAYQALSKKFKWVGWLGVLSAFLIMTFYSVLGGYCFEYIALNLAGIGFGSATATGSDLFANMLTNPVASIIFTLMFMAVTGIIVSGGIKNGIEKFSKFAMPALFVMLVVVIIRAVTLPGAEKGLEFMFKPNFEYLGENFITVLSTAGGQMFFSLSLGMGAMITYGSYLSKKEGLEKNAVLIPAADTLVALFAGLAVLPAAFALGGEGAAMSGPKLLFVTLQDVFANMGVIGPYFGVIFYVLVLIAAITSAISLVEAIGAYFLDKKEAKLGITNSDALESADNETVAVSETRDEGDDPVMEKYRKKVTLWVCVAISALACIVAADGLGSNGLWQPLGFCWLDFMDLWSEGIMMPLAALFMALFIGYEWKVDNFAEEVTLDGRKFRSKGFFKVCVMVIVPLAMVFILIGQLQTFGIIPAFPWW